MRVNLLTTSTFLRLAPTTLVAGGLLVAIFIGSVMEFRSELRDEIREKISLFTDVAQDAVIPAMTADTIYEVPLLFDEAGLGDLLVRDLRLEDVAHEPDLSAWRAMGELIKRP